MTPPTDPPRAAGREPATHLCTRCNAILDRHLGVPLYCPITATHPETNAEHRFQALPPESPNASREAGAGEVETAARHAAITGDAEWAALLDAARPVVDAGEAHTRCHCEGRCEHHGAWRDALAAFDTRLRALNSVRLAGQLAALRPPAGVRETADDARWDAGLAAMELGTLRLDLSADARCSGDELAILDRSIAALRNAVSRSALPPAGRREAEDTTLRKLAREACDAYVRWIRKVLHTYPRLDHHEVGDAVISLALHLGPTPVAADARENPPTEDTTT